MCSLSQCFAAYGNAGTQSETFAFVAAVVLNVAGSEGGRLKAVFAFVFCALARRDDAAFEVCMVSDLDLIAVFSGINTALLFALIGFSILNAFYMQVARICLYAFADKLRTFEGGIPAASDGGLSGCAADMGVAAGCFCLIAVVAC